MGTNNEWTQLKKIIVGVADYAKVPNIDLSLRCVNYSDRQNVSDILSGSYPQQVINEANEDLEILCDFLRKQSVEVVRPEKTDCNYYNYCPRDSVFVHGDLHIATPMSIRARKDEWRASEQHLNNPIDLSAEHSDESYNIKCINNKDTLALNEIAPIFDAANIVRANDEILYLVSNSGNRKGAEKLQELLGSRARVRTVEGIYSFMHIDSTIAFLREGLLLANPNRVKSKDDLPKPFCDWDIIWCPEPVDIGHYPNICNASPWVNINLLNINENLVILEENQGPTRKILEKYRIECAMLPMRQSRTLGGCFHCVTLDLERD